MYGSTSPFKRVPPASESLILYHDQISEAVYDEIWERAKALKGLKVALINATPFGGGVAEMFSTWVPLMRSLAIDVSWYVLPPSKPFFAVTKKIHNALQGGSDGLTLEEMETYRSYSSDLAAKLGEIDADIMEIHDPQPLGIGSLSGRKNLIWRCHIDTSNPHTEVKDFLMPFLLDYERYVFSDKEFIIPGIDVEKVKIFRPTIDAFTKKNKQLSPAIAAKLVAKEGVDTRRPFITQISRFDTWKDPWGVIDAYRIVKETVPGVQLALIGSMALDDPEGPGILKSVQEYAKGDTDIHLIASAEANDLQVNAFQDLSTVVVQKSLREGFGLTVTEAMWKGNPVVGGNVGGIRAQIEDGVSGFLVNSPEECAQKCLELIGSPETRERMGAAAIESVRKQFLHPRLMLDYLKLYSELR